MNIDELTLGQIKQPQSLLSNQTIGPDHSEIVGKFCVARSYSSGSGSGSGAA